MFIKIYKTINKNFPKVLSFFFFLRYLFAIFFIALIIFFLMPKIFDYEKKRKMIQNHLINNYNLDLYNYDTIVYKVFPLPNLQLKNSKLKIKNKPLFINVDDIQIFFDIKEIYNSKSLNPKKIILTNGNINLKIDTSSEIMSFIENLKYKFRIENFNLKFKKDEQLIFNLNKINFANYGYNANSLNGEIFGKRFEVIIDEDNRDLDFKILNSGINAKINFDKREKNFLSGFSKINLLNTYLKFNFSLSEEELNIINANLRNKYLTLSLNSLIKLEPYFEVNNEINLSKINTSLLNKLDLEKNFNIEVIKKLNSNNKIIYKGKNSRNNIFREHLIDFSLANGILSYSSKIFFSGGSMFCNGSSLLIEEYPRLNFNCNVNIKNMKKFLKKFSIKRNIKVDMINLNISGSINLFNKKINLEKLLINDNKDSREEDLKYFKEKFENIFFKDNFFSIFKKENIKEFILEVS